MIISVAAPRRALQTPPPSLVSLRESPLAGRSQVASGSCMRRTTSPPRLLRRLALPLGTPTSMRGFSARDAGAARDRSSCKLKAPVQAVMGEPVAGVEPDSRALCAGRVKGRVL